ncbi:MAG: hypothetical protein IAI50_07880 [Candidatus Eremiobacteraeota bacterium]|nr:hypothetical protein [Candidatus Eremiobacteraeota bacterium]
MFPSAAAALVLASSAVVAAADAPPAHHVRGTVSAVAGNKITIATAQGSVTVTTGATTRYAGVVPASANDIMAGTFIGTANVPGAGAARALEVVVFPKAMAGTGEGDYPWDLPATSGHMSSMTNGTVAAPKMSSMTNATVSHVDNGSMKTVTLTYKGGTKVVAIPSGVAIVRIVPASKAAIVPGAHVVAFPPLTSLRSIVVGEHGAVPPM